MPQALSTRNQKAVPCNTYARTVGLDLYIANRRFCHPPFDLRILLTHVYRGKEPFSPVGFFWFIIRREAPLGLSFRARSLSDWPRGNRKAKGWICVGHDFKKKISPSTYPEIATWANSEREIPTVRYEARPDIFAPRPSACHDHCSSKRRLRPSGGSLATAPHPVVDVCGVTHFAKNPPVLRAARGPHPLAPRQAQRWRLPRWAELVSWGRRSFLPRAPGGRCAAPPRCAPRLAPRPRGGPSRPSPARRPARPPKVRTRRPVTRAHSLPAPREPDLHLFVFFPPGSFGPLSTRAARPRSLPVLTIH